MEQKMVKIENKYGTNLILSSQKKNAINIYINFGSYTKRKKRINIFPQWGEKAFYPLINDNTFI